MMCDNVTAMKSGRSTDFSHLEFLGGDTYKGTYVPPLAAEVMKEMQAEQAAAAKAAQEAAAPKTDKFEASSKAAPAKPAVKLSAATEARLDGIANAPHLTAAFKELVRMPELLERAEQSISFRIHSDVVPDKQAKAQSVGCALIIEGKTNSARYYGSDVHLDVMPHLLSSNKVIVAMSVRDLFGAADMRSNSYRTIYEDKTQRLRFGLGKYLPGAVGVDDIAKSLPKLTPQMLADSVGAALRAS